MKRGIVSRRVDMRCRWLGRNLLQVAAGILIIAIVGWMVNFSADRQKEKNVRPGWVMVRAPGNLQSVTLYQNEVWAGGINGLFRFDSSAQKLPLPVGTSDFGAVYELLADREGNLWVAHQQGLSYYKGNSWHSCDLSPVKPKTPVTALLQDREGAFWLGLPDGVLYMSTAGQKFQQLSMGPVDVLFQDNLGRIWVGSSDPRRGGLVCQAGNGWKSYGTADGLVHPSVTCVTQTTDGTLWIGTGFATVGGANYFTQTGVLAAFTRQDGLAGDKVRQIYQDLWGNLWFCSEYDGVAVFKGKERIALFTTADGLAGQEVKKIVQDGKGNYWLATSEGLNMISEPF
jgi:ligand-binding sensor domain-containing protein